MSGTRRATPAALFGGGIGIDRRKALGLGAAAAGAAWVAPAILSADAAAAATQPPPGCTFTPVTLDPTTIQSLPIPGGYQTYFAVTALGASGWTVTQGQVESVNTSFYGAPCSGQPVSSAAAVLDLVGTGQAAGATNRIENGAITLPCAGRYQISVLARGNPQAGGAQTLTYGTTGTPSTSQSLTVNPCQLSSASTIINANIADSVTLFVQYVLAAAGNAGPLLQSVSLLYLGP